MRRSQQPAGLGSEQRASVPRELPVCEPQLRLEHGHLHGQVAEPDLQRPRRLQPWALLPVQRQDNHIHVLASAGEGQGMRG